MDEYNVMYVVYSTSNTPYQHWQCDLLEYTAKKCGQEGKLYCLCCENEHDKKYDFERKPIGDTTVIKYPSFMKNDETKDMWGIANKFHSLELFMKNNDIHGSLLNLDPDMCFLKPVNVKTVPGVVIGQEWVDGFFQDPIFKDKSITTVDIKKEHMYMYPFIMHTDDMRQILDRFIDLCYKIKIKYNKWESDMFALIIATVEYGLQINFEKLGCCNNWSKYRNDKEYPIIHYPGMMYNDKNEKIWFKQDYTRETYNKPWNNPPCEDQETNYIEKQLLKQINECIQETQ